MIVLMSSWRSPCARCVTQSVSRDRAGRGGAGRCTGLLGSKASRRPSDLMAAKCPAMSVARMAWIMDVRMACTARCRQQAAAASAIVDHRWPCRVYPAVLLEEILQDVGGWVAQDLEEAVGVEVLQHALIVVAQRKR
jgi:hypothetical protein